VPVDTADWIQGKEAFVAVFNMTVTAKHRLLFVQDPQRICVGITRHVGALFIVGDINSVTDRHVRVEELVVSDDGQSLSGKKTMFRDFVRYFVSKRGVV
jgi:superfamily I DNA and/or RNA helicase